ncbi:hypothetical protein TH53_19965 [Pedobacter lusitanus]|uniref:DUF3592 domain-containing protein n=1 Tax=Pedobacter lusitanus TaxID=1503925 RepID=A0A0D0GDY2_9SPHI|nr:DUF3592 domain-containing protein [Pedobacter lusitanus]KIO75557.1 hypothetical protein TH53_19965 [Pedobacter lusitanus]
MIYVLIAGLLMSGFGLFKVLERRQYKRSGIRVPGVVSDIVLCGRNYYPIVNYQTLDKQDMVEEYGMGTSPSVYKRGEQVKVIYKQEDCTKFIIDNRSSAYIEIIFLVIGLLAIAGAGLYLMQPDLFDAF